MCTIICNDEYTQLISLLAAARIGMSVFLTTNPSKIYETSETVGVKYILTDTTAAPIEHVQLVHIDISMIENSVAQEDLIGYQMAETSSPWIIIEGSGTTGKSKLIPVTHHQQIERIKLSFECFGADENDRFASMVNTGFYSALFMILSSLYNRVPVVLYDRKNDILETCRSLGITILYSTVYHVERMIEKMGDEDTNVYGFLKALLVAGASVSSRLREKIAHTITKKLYVGYGANEGGSLVRAVPPYSYTLSGNVGKPLSGVCVEIVDDNDALCPIGTVGNIRIKSSSLIDNYFDDQEASENAFKKGWFYPKDIGKWSDEGFLIHLGRSDDMMMMQGINIYPAEIESVMLEYRGVNDAAAFPIKSTLHQHIPVCAVTVSDIKINEKDLMMYARKRMGNRSPRKVVIVNEIPRTETGKIIKKKLLNLIDRKMRGSFSPNRQKQPQKSFTIVLHQMRGFNTIHCDEWLRKGLKIEPKELAYPNIADENIEIPAYIPAMISRVLLMVREFLQGVKIPVFDTGKIVAIKKIHHGNDQKYQVTLSIAQIDNIPEHPYIVAIETALEVIKRYQNVPFSLDALEGFYDFINTKIIQPLGKSSGSGKSTIPVLSAAYERDISFHHFGNGVYQLGWGAKSILMNRSMVESDSQIGSQMAHNKVSTANVIRMAGMPAPVHVVINDKKMLFKTAEKLGWPLVVKPADLDRGEGVSVGLNDRESLEKGFNTAFRVSRSKRIIIEKEVPGVCHRIFVAYGKILYVVKRLPKSVIGDGERTLKELIDRANEHEKLLPPWKRSENFPMDDLAMASIQEAGLTLEAIPEKGRVVSLRKIESTQWGGYDEDMTSSIHPANREIALKSADLFRLSVAGIDIISEDISKPWYENGAIINEVNFSPLFGGGEISKRSIPAFFEIMMGGGDGFIPVNVFIGNAQAWEKAKNEHRVWMDNGINGCITSSTVTLKPDGSILHFEFTTLKQRLKALMIDRSVEALIVVAMSKKELEELPYHDRFEIVYQE